MKKISLFALVLYSGLSVAQIEVPSKVTTAFESQFKEVENVEWNVGSNNYEAQFEWNNQMKTSTFSKDGKWMQTNTSLDVEDLDENIQNSLSKKFKSFDFESIEFIETPKETFYQFTILTEEGDQIVVQMSKSGSILSSTKIEDNGGSEDEEMEEDESEDGE